MISTEITCLKWFLAIFLYQVVSGPFLKGRPSKTSHNFQIRINLPNYQQQYLSTTPRITTGVFGISYSLTNSSIVRFSRTGIEFSPTQRHGSTCALNHA